MASAIVNELIGQQLAKKIITQNLTKKGDIYNFLFFGPEGVGKRSAALLLAKTVLCPDHGCGNCIVCQKIERLALPDFILIVPLPPQIKDIDTFDYTKKFASLTNSPLIEDKATITIEQIRNLQSKLKFRPLGGQKRVIVILDADRMNIYAANCFLKTLEEPPPNTIFMLTTSRLYSIIATVRSRCQLVPFRYLQGTEIREIIRRHTTEDKIDEVEDFGLGSAGEAYRIMESNYLAAALEIFKLTPLAPATLLKLIGEYEKKPLLSLLYILLIFYRASILMKFGQPSIKKYSDIIEKKAKKCDLKKLYESCQRLNNALFELSFNPNKKLFLVSVLTSLN